MTEIPLADCLLPAIQELWSGQIAAFTGEGPLGSVVISNGKVAWATCKDQSETLGMFLWRLGRITKGQFVQVQKVYEANKGEKKLAAILEETGFMSQQVLRRCLMLHTRSAITKLLSHDDATVTLTDSEPRTDERMLFGPEEVLPIELTSEITSEWSGVDNAWTRSWYSVSEDNDVLHSFSDLGGYMASAIISFDGDVLAGHVLDSNIDLPILAVNVAAMLESSTRAIRCTRIPSLDHIMIDCNEGGLTARWIDEEQRHLIFVLTGAQGRISIVRYCINVSAPALREWLVKKTRPGMAIPRDDIAVPTDGEPHLDSALDSALDTSPDATRADEDDDSSARTDPFSIYSQQRKRKASDFFATRRMKED